jgi:hypothetical protein
MRTGFAAAAGSPRTGQQSLKPRPLDTETIYHARRIAAGWREAGLDADLIEHFSPESGIDGYALTARYPDRILCCVCRCRGAGRGPSIWTIEVVVSRRWLAGEGVPGEEAPQRAGFAVAATHEEAWRQVQAWQQGELSLQPEFGPVAAGTLPPAERALAKPSRWGAVALIGVAAALGLATFGSYDASNTIAAFETPPVGAVAEPAADVPSEGPPPAQAGGDRVIADRKAWANPGRLGDPAAMPAVEAVALVRPAPSPSTRADHAADEPSGRLATPEQRQPSPDPAFALQVASVRGTTTIPGTWDRLRAKFPAELAGLELYPPPSGSGSSNRFHRVVAGAFATRAEAQAACDRLRAAGGDCLIIEAPEQPG